MELVLYICSVNNHKHIYTMTQSQYLVMKEMVTKYEEKQKEIVVETETEPQPQTEPDV
mgnify:CR=1 FL=1